MKARYERIKIGPHWVQRLLPREEAWVKDFVPEDCPPDNLGTTLFMQLSSTACIAAGYYLADRVEDAKHWAQRLVSQVMNYFFGDWRQKMQNNPNRPEEVGYWARGGGSWVDEYRMSTAFACALGDWDAVWQLSEHPSEDKFKKDAGTNASLAPWYLLLSEYLARGKTPNYRQRLEELKTSGTPGLGTLARALDAIVEKEPAELNEEFAQHMRYYLKHQKHKDEIGFKLALDATILYHLAIRHQMPLSMPDDWKDHLVIL